jgi:hypothetical protein
MTIPAARAAASFWNRRIRGLFSSMAAQAK